MQVLKDIREELRSKSDKQTAENAQRFFKESVHLYGVTSPAVETISKQYFPQIKNTSPEDIFALCEDLWKSGYMEESFIACHWSYYIHKQYKTTHFQVFERWIHEYVTNWAACDTLCNHTIGTFIEMYPEYISKVKDWTSSSNRWVKRAAAVTLIIPARKGLFLDDICDISDRLLLDNDDLVQKGYGWMLKAASQAHQEKIFQYVMKHKDKMPRTALRYAIEKMPKELRKQAMEK